MRWQRGDAIVRRELVHGRPWLGQPALVVEDTAELLAIYVPGGSELAFPDGDWPGGRHPWQGHDRWQGHGVLQLQRPDEAHAVWIFWHGPGREFRGWYVNLQEPFRRRVHGIDTEDHELDIVLATDGTWEWKDEELVEPWIERGRWTEEKVAAIRAEGDRVAAELDAGRRWWSDEWARWEPEPHWEVPELPEGWDRVE
jgi:hypothetical protein